MRKIISSFLLILALAFVGAGLPLYMDSIDLELDLSSDAPDVDEEVDLHYSLEHQELSASEHLIEFTIDLSDVPEDLHPTSSGLLEISLLQNDQKVRDVSDESFQADIQIDQHENPHALSGSIHLFPEAFQAPDGDYRLQVRFLSADSSDLIPPKEIPLSFSSIKMYSSAVWDAPPNTTALTLYFPEEEHEHLIPITRFVPRTNTTLRETVTQLEQGPADHLGLALGSPIPRVPRIHLSAGVTSLYLTSPSEPYSVDPSIARTAAYSLIESLGSINEVREIQFYFDNQIIAEGFKGVNTSERFYPSQGISYFPAFVGTEGRALLFPVYTDQADIALLLENLKYHNQHDFYHHRVQPTIPHFVELLNHEISEDRLVLNFNPAFEEYITQHPVHGKMMMDSILLTVGSLPEINFVEFLTEGEPVHWPADMNLESPLPIPPYVNPEN